MKPAVQPRRAGRIALAVTLILAVGVGIGVVGGNHIGRMATEAGARDGADQAGKGNGERGELVTVHPIRSLPTPDEVRDELTAADFAADSVHFGVDGYQLVYRTVAADGTPTIASGLLTLPRNQQQQLPVVSYAHGTELHRADAPSHWRDGWAAAPAVTFAAAGFATVAPDYLGMGLGPGPHPYLHLPSAATASLDMLRAARQFVGDQDRQLTREVYVTGFSQGATAATALARMLQDSGDDWFELGALAPISGAYAFAEVELPALLDGTVPAPYNVGYSAYLVVAWDRLHGLYEHPAEFFAEPYAEVVEQLFDGLRTGEELAPQLPGEVAELYTPEGLELLRNPSGPLAAALAEHDESCAGFRPDTQVRLLASAVDEQVPAANNEHCLAALRAAGVEATVVDLGGHELRGSVHLGANVTGTGYAVDWFSQLR